MSAQRYEIAYFPDGLATSPLWVRQTSLLRPPGRSHPTDLHDLRTLVDEAWVEGEGRWTAWPVHHPAAARDVDLRRPTSAERRLLDDHRARQRVDRRAAGEVPIRIRHPRRGDWVVDGVVHELTSPGRTRCGLAEDDLVELGSTFHHSDPQACPACRASTGG